MDRRAESQVVPVKVYESADRLTIAAPMAGIEPENICIEVTPGNQLVLYGSARGSFKGETVVHADEWNPGPYCRELALPTPVDGRLANITYGNGVLVVVLPIAERVRPAHLGLGSVGPDRGERAGNAGHPIHALSNNEHGSRHGHRRHE